MTAVLLTLKLATLTTLLLLIIGLPISWWLANTQARYRSLIEAILATPLVLPPTVLGFYFLIWLSPNSLIGGGIALMGLPSLLFTFEGLVLASAIYSLPFMTQPLQLTFSHLSPSLLEAAAGLGLNRFQRFIKVVLPLSWKGIVTACALSFCHTVGEFGVALMVGGSIEGETKILSIAIFEAVESLNYSLAHQYALILIITSIVTLTLLYSFSTSRVPHAQR